MIIDVTDMKCFYRFSYDVLREDIIANTWKREKKKNF